MWHWQLKNWLNTSTLFAKILVASIVGHLLALFGLLIVYRAHEQYHILVTGSMINTDVPIVFLPLHKTLRQAQAAGSSGATGQAAALKPESKSSVVQKKGTFTVSLPESKKEKSSKRKISPKAKKGSEKKKATEISSAPKKKVAEKKSVEPEKKIEQKQEQPIQTAVETTQPIQESKALVTDALLPATGDQNVLYVGQQEMDALQLQDYIQQEMAQHWSPPAGMRKNICSVVKVTIGFDGTVASVTLEQPSGVMIFDDAAKRAAAQLTPPQWAHGKEIVMTFTP